MSERTGKVRAAIFFLSLFLCLPSWIFSDSGEWELKKNQNGITVYTRYGAGSNLKEVRVVNEVESSLSALVALLLDVQNYPDWIYACSEAATLKIINDEEQYQYQVTDAPWPVSDRDIATHFTMMQDVTTKAIRITSTGEPGYIPEKKGRVRVQHFQSSYIFTPLGEGKVKVEFELYVDPGGSVPAWLINSNIVTAPYKTTLAMVEELPKYQTASFSFIKEP